MCERKVLAGCGSGAWVGRSTDFMAGRLPGSGQLSALVTQFIGLAATLPAISSLLHPCTLLLLLLLLAGRRAGPSVPGRDRQPAPTASP